MTDEISDLYIDSDGYYRFVCKLGHEFTSRSANPEACPHISFGSYRECDKEIAYRKIPYRTINAEVEEDLIRSWLEFHKRYRPSTLEEPETPQEAGERIAREAMQMMRADIDNEDTML